MALAGDVRTDDGDRLSQENSEIAGNSKLSAEDMARVEKYLSSPIHSVERRAFRPYMMMLVLMGVVGGLSLLSVMISMLVLE